MTARIVYSTGIGSLCPNCRRAVQDCVCPRGAPGAAKGGPAHGGPAERGLAKGGPAHGGPANPGAVRVGREVKGRAGKGVTTVTGLRLPPAEIDALATRLKKRCGSGGTVRGGVIEIQGDHREVIVAELVKLGWAAKKAGG